MGRLLLIRMDRPQPLLHRHARLSEEQIAWVGGFVGGPIVSWSEALRHVVSQAMARDMKPRKRIRLRTRADA